jgi:hypothetical protein
MKGQNLKTVLVAASATTVLGGRLISSENGVSLWSVKTPCGEIVIAVGVGSFPMLLAQHTNEEAERRANSTMAMRIGTVIAEAVNNRRLGEAEWSINSPTLIEVPRSMFLKLQLFLSWTELKYRFLNLTGFRSPTT